MTFILGLVLASFLNVVAERTINGERWTWSRSKFVFSAIIAFLSFSRRMPKNTLPVAPFLFIGAILIFCF